MKAGRVILVLTMFSFIGTMFTATALAYTVSTEQVGYSNLTNGSITVSGHYLYDGHHDNFTIVDVSKPFKPVIVSTMYVHMDSNFGDFFPIGKYVYMSGYHHGIYVIDVSNPKSPTIAWRYTANIADHISVSKNDMGFWEVGWITGDNGLQIYDISNQSKPILKSTLQIPDCRDSKLSDNYLYIADNDGLKIYDVHNMSSPILKGIYNISNIYSIIVSDKHVYVTTKNMLSIIDVKNPSKPVLKGSCNIANLSFENPVIDNNYIYVRTFDGHVIVDISNPMKPAVVGKINLTGTLAISKDYIYISSVDGLHILKLKKSR